MALVSAGGAGDVSSGICSEHRGLGQGTSDLLGFGGPDWPVTRNEKKKKKKTFATHDPDATAFKKHLPSSKSNFY